MNRPVSKLRDLEIDEVSVVDRPANQHGLIAFAKNDTQEDQMDIFDADGQPVDIDDLEHGDIVYGEDGTEFVFSEEAEVEVEEDERELATVGKAGLPGTVGAAFKTGIANAKGAGAYAMKNKKPLGIGAGVGATAGFGAGRVGKSLGDEVLEALSKAVTDTDRDEIIAKAMNEVEVIKAENAELSKALEAEQDARITEAFISKASEYNLPVSPGVLGPILKAVAEVLDDEQLDVLDALFTSVGDTLYQEIGYVGDTDNDSVLDRVNAVTDELIAKSDVSRPEAMVHLFETNPDVYDAYIAENGR